MRTHACCLLICLGPSGRAAADAERTVAKLAIPAGKTTKAMEAWVTRKRADDGGVQVRLVTQGPGSKAQALTIYSGGGDDDGPSDKAVREIKAQAFELPDGQRAIRIDLRFVIPGTKSDLQTDTTLVGFEGKPHKLLELTTGSDKPRSATCRENRETQIRLSPAGKPLRIEALTVLTLDPALGDDDLPVDKTCKGRKPVSRQLYRFDKDRFVEMEEDEE
jgi:hypothetical protein